MLVVDDDPVDRMLLQKAFAEAQGKVDLLFEDSGMNALSYMMSVSEKSLAHVPDVCIFDINMPGLSGIELLKRFKSHSEYRKIPVFMLSSSDDRNDIASCYELQASGYICKPNDYAVLQTMIDNLSRFWVDTLSFPRRTSSMQ